MHESVQAFKQTIERYRQQVHDLKTQAEQVKRSRLPTLHTNALDTRLTELRERLHEYEALVNDYQQATTSGETGQAAYFLSLIQILQAGETALEQAHTKLNQKHQEAHRLQAIIDNHDYDPPDAS